jgi:hypothetical protein
MAQYTDQMVMITPVYSDIDKTQQITKKYRQLFLQCHPARIMGCFDFQYHDCYNNGNNTIAECFQSVFIHIAVRGSYQDYKGELARSLSGG